MDQRIRPGAEFNFTGAGKRKTIRVQVSGKKYIHVPYLHKTQLFNEL